ncbi:hypothetical protein [Streptomyces sp. V1I1]|uniref:hypothetical protein n=1 Tax=Streptomyces sp. V1I1 TaxID=3042272 RepID=UPI002783F1FE|nr:hypothetical protein [Streptomyces sp. V1I1]MDQ0942235.1 hypothetical protein [Streptomyces sp. V1I1]
MLLPRASYDIEVEGVRAEGGGHAEKQQREVFLAAGSGDPAQVELRRGRPGRLPMA